jgi:hypothetical protein
MILDNKIAETGQGSWCELIVGQVTRISRLPSPSRQNVKAKR